MDRLRVAVIVVAHDSAGALPATLRSVQEQLTEGDELVVVDNASRDGSAAVARDAAPAARVIERPVNDGFGAGCHAAAAGASAELLFFLNPDAELEPGCLDAIRAVAASRPGWGAWQALVMLPDAAHVNTNGGVTHWSGIAWAGGCDTPVAASATEPCEVSFASGAALAVRREAWEATGGFEPAYFVYGEDVDLSLRLRLAGWGVGVAPDARVRHAYGFEKGAYKWFYLERNRWWTILATYPLRILVAVAPALLVLELTLLLAAARGGWLVPKLRAQVAVLRTLRWALRRRRRVQAGRRIGAPAFARALGSSLDSRYLGPVAELEAVRTLQARYWAIATALTRTGPA